NRRDISQFTDSLQTVSAEFLRGFVHKTGLGGSLCGTSGCDDDDIVGNTFLHKLNVSVVRTDLRVVASYHGNSAADNAGSDALKERLGGAKFVYLRVGNTVKDFNDRFCGVTYSSLLLQLRDMYEL